MSLPHALLGLLAVEPASGYALTRAFGTDFGRYAWHAGHTSIYPELTRLAERGLVEVTAEGARGSRIYAVTDAGRTELRDWLMDRPTRRSTVRNEGILRLFLLSTLAPHDARTLLTEIVADTETEASHLREVRASSLDESCYGPAGFGQLAAEYGLRTNEAVNGWARWALDRLDEGEG